MKANIYKAFSNEAGITEIQAGHTLAQEFDGLDLDNTVFIVNGHKVQPDYIIKDGDIITVRVLPGAASTALAVGLFIGAAALIGGVAFGVNMYWQQQSLNEKMEAMKKMSNAPTIDNRPFLRGASNTVAVGNSQPYIVGHNFFTPYLHSAPFYTLEGTDGADQYTYRCLECGFNKQILKKIGMADTIIKTFTDTTAQQGAFDLDKTALSEGVGEISQNGALLQTLPEINYKHYSRLYNAAIARNAEIEEGAEEFKQQLTTNAMSVDVAISFPQGLYEYNDDGDKIETTVNIIPSYSLNGGATWENFTFNNNGVLSNTFKRNAQKELRYVASHVFTFNELKTLANSGNNNVLIRVNSDGAKDSKKRNDCYVMYIQSKCYDPNKTGAPVGVASGSSLVPCLVVEDRERAFCTILGLKMKATRANSEQSDKINIITDGAARTWTGTGWTTTKTATSNPAAWILETLTSDTHPASKILDSEIDLESLGALYELCEREGFYYDQVITQSQKKETLLKDILRACDAVLYRDIYGRYAVAADMVRPNALAVFNSENIISISNAKEFTRKADGVRIKFINSDNDLFIEDTYLLMREENGHPLPINENTIIKDIQLTGITHYKHVIKYARRLMAKEVLRPKVTTIEIGNEGVFFTPYSKVLIQDNSLKIGLGSGVITQVEYVRDKLKYITISNPVYFDPAKRYGITINTYNSTEGGDVLELRVKGTGTTNKLEVVGDVYITDPKRPEFNNVYSFGEYERVTTPYIINDIKRTGGRFALELVNYNPAIFDAGTIPPYRPNITEPAGKVAPLPEYQEAIPGAPGADGLTILIEKPALLYFANNNGYVEELEQSSRIDITQKGERVPFTIGDIVSPPGMEVEAVGNTVYIKSLVGVNMARQGVIQVPLIYRPIIATSQYTDESNVYIYTDESNAEQYGEIKYSAKKYIYNVYISYAKSIKGDAGKPGEPGKQGNRGASYHGTVKPADPVLDDFYLNPDTCLLYVYNAKEAPEGPWAVIPETDPRYLQAIEDIIDNVNPDDPAQADILAKANVYALKLVSKTILASKIFTQQLELTPGESGAPAYIQGNYTPGKSGFKLDSDGNAEFNNATVRGTVDASKGILDSMLITDSVYNEPTNDWLGLYSNGYKDGEGFNLATMKTYEEAVEYYGRLSINKIRVDEIEPFSSPQKSHELMLPRNVRILRPMFSTISFAQPTLINTRQDFIRYLQKVGGREIPNILRLYLDFTASFRDLPGGECFSGACCVVYNENDEKNNIEVFYGGDAKFNRLRFDSKDLIWLRTINYEERRIAVFSCNAY